MWVVGKNEFYHKETGRRHFAEKYAPPTAVRHHQAYRGEACLNRTKKAIAQIADYIPRACRGMQLQEAKARPEKKLRSILMTAVIPPFLTRRSHQLLTVTLGSLFFVHRSATPPRRQPVSKIDYQALRAKAEKATCGEWSLEYGKSRFDGDDALIHREVAGYIPICRIEGAHPESGFDEDFQIEQQANAEFIAAANPATVTALLDELERNQQYIKRRDQRTRKLR